MRFGKNPAKNDYRTLRFQDFLSLVSLPPPPVALDVLAKVYAKLHISDPTVLFPMDANDQYGDCTIAALAHAQTVYKGLLGQKVIMPAATVVKDYFHLTGGVDSGLYVLEVLAFWRNHVDRILAYVKMNPLNHDHVKHAIEMFGGVYLGFQVPTNCIAQFKAREPWTPGPLTNNGHAVYAVAYDATYLTVLTWGNTQKATWAWWDECVDEAYAILPREAQTAGWATGFNFTQLQASLAAVAN